MCSFPTKRLLRCGRVPTQEAADESWRNLYQSLAEKGDVCKAMARRAEQKEQVGKVPQLEICKPTSGWYSLVFAAQICDEVRRPDLSMRLARFLSRPATANAACRTTRLPARAAALVCIRR